MSEPAVGLSFQDGLVPAVAQDADSGEVLMLAYADREAVERTVETGLGHYYSRSRDELWQKGESSGHVQHVREVRVDCDGDALLYLVDQEGGACHTGQRSCFFRAVEGVATASENAGDGAGAGEDDVDDASDGDDGLRLDVERVGEEVFDPDAVYD